MARIRDDVIPTAQGDDEEALKTHAVIHLKGTGFPWQDEANVYIAGHRLGYPNTESFLTFWDLDNVKKGDEVYITDANGTSTAIGAGHHGRMRTYSEDLHINRVDVSIRRRV
jgi:sortase A